MVIKMDMVINNPMPIKLHKSQYPQHPSMHCFNSTPSLRLALPRVQHPPFHDICSLQLLHDLQVVVSQDLPVLVVGCNLVLDPSRSLGVPRLPAHFHQLLLRLATVLGQLLQEGSSVFPDLAVLGGAPFAPSIDRIGTGTLSGCGGIFVGVVDIQISEKILFLFLLFFFGMSIGGAPGFEFLLEISLQNLLLELEEGLKVVVFLSIIFQIEVKTLAMVAIADVVAFLLLYNLEGLLFLLALFDVGCGEGHDGELYLFVVPLEVVVFLQLGEVHLQALDLVAVLLNVLLLDLLLDAPVGREQAGRMLHSHFNRNGIQPAEPFAPSSTKSVHTIIDQVSSHHHRPRSQSILYRNYNQNRRWPQQVGYFDRQLLQSCPRKASYLFWVQTPTETSVFLRMSYPKQPLSYLLSSGHPLPYPLPCPLPYPLPSPRCLPSSLLAPRSSSKPDLLGHKLRLSEGSALCSCLMMLNCCQLEQSRAGMILALRQSSAFLKQFLSAVKLVLPLGSTEAYRAWSSCFDFSSVLRLPSWYL